MSGPGVALTTRALPTTWMRGDEMPKGTPGRAPCSVDGCEKTSQARGLCTVHYDRERNAGRLAPLPRRAPIERFWASVDRTGECWLWTGEIGKRGYGQFWDGARKVSAHRWSYENFVGLIPEGLQLDHLCHTNDQTCTGGFDCTHRRCVCPSHLEPVTGLVNQQRGAYARKTHCKHGHEFTPENTKRTPKGRQCRECCRESVRKWQARKRAEAEVERLKPLLDASL